MRQPLWIIPELISANPRVSMYLLCVIIRYQLLPRLRPRVIMLFVPEILCVAKFAPISLRSSFITAAKSQSISVLKFIKMSGFEKVAESERITVE